ncbi:hypothetical protein EJB05_20969 [Eragrostis curvula]|uniref:NB-ARC domain-containing protein n=1 Tax=Eragrostis curvula TaxID=38414 RepID=A0A5J9V0I3_9POAL|nr:hypothetical protein EJB05_20969 [Eragrostis curvula]
MAGLFASMAVKRSLANLSSLLPATTSMPSAAVASSQGLEHLRMLETTMHRIHAMLLDAEQHWNLHEESANLRLKELKDLAYDAEEVVEEYEYEVNRCRVEAFEQAAAVQGGGVSSSKRKRQDVYDEHGIVKVPSELALGARKVTERFTEMKDYSDIFSLSENDGERKVVPDIHVVRQTSSFVYAPRILGREKDREQVIKKLMASSGEGSSCGSHMSVLAIVGMGGLGKTTLAQLVYNDTRVFQSFDLRAWVCVSEYFNVENITRKIITSLTKNTCHHIQDCVLQWALVDEVKEKSILLVLDDVWNEKSEYWKLLCMPLLASRRCHIIVTTRSKTVASLVQTMPIYNLNCLCPDDSWSLFKQTAFVAQETATPENLVVTGRSITEKCNGLPLAIKTLGSILRYENDENKWRDVLESELWDLKQSKNEVLPALELSYKCMPMHLKCCFVSLSLYSKGIYLDEYRVISLWKLLDLLQCDGNDNMDEIGHIYFSELVQRSLLQNYIEGERVMHDLVHDLACFLAGEEFFRLEGGKPVEIPRDTRYISILSRDNSIEISNMSQSLRVITMIETSDIENPEVLFLNCKKFRVIDIEQGRLANALFDFMGSMKLLRHVSLARYEDSSLPNSVFQLFNLCTMDIEALMLHGIGRLVNLHTLPRLHLSKCGCFFNITELRNMNKIKKLCMSGLCNVSIRDANEAHLESKRNLEVLELDFNASKSCDHKEGADGNPATVTVSGVQLLESLQPHYQSLKVLRLKNFNFDKYPSWLGRTSFTQLTELLLQGCQSDHCPTLGELPSLKYLKISGIEQVKRIGREFCSLDPGVKGFPLLARLSIEDMYGLQEWSGVEVGDFLRLETLLFWCAFELRSLPLASFSSLRELALYNCTSLATFQSSATLQELRISTCASLNELPALPSLQSLELFDCPSLTTLAHFPSLTILSLHAPFKEEILYRLVNSNLSIEYLSVWSDILMSIHLDPQKLLSLKELVLCGRNLQYCDELGSLSSLKKLNICADLFISRFTCLGNHDSSEMEVSTENSAKQKKGMHSRASCNVSIRLMVMVRTLDSYA